MITITGAYFIVCESKEENLFSLGWRRDFLWIMDHRCWENPLIMLTGIDNQQNICEILHSFGAVLGKRICHSCSPLSCQVPFPFPPFVFGAWFWGFWFDFLGGGCGFVPKHIIKNLFLSDSVSWILQCFMEHVVSEIIKWICFPPVQLAQYQRYWMYLSILGEKTVFTVPFSVLVSIKIFLSS